jgi:LysR family transcriptional regulator, transcriptional activator of nhaA
MAQLNYKHLHYFWMTAKAGGVVKAAERLHATPQTVSGQIKLLEEALGQALFRKQGRRLVLTDEGRVALSYADEIFALGGELGQALGQARELAPTLELRVGVADAVPKTIAYRLLEPAYDLPQTVRVVCREAPLRDLLARLAIHQLDLILADEPLARLSGIKAFNHELGHTTMCFFAAPALHATLSGEFPACLNNAPMMLPASHNPVRRQLETWFTQHKLRPQVVGEFDDGALMKAFGREGRGIIVGTRVLQEETCAQYKVDLLGHTDELVQDYWAISPERRIVHPAVAAITSAAREMLVN